MRKWRTRKQKGFTLVELVAILFLIAILSAFAIPKYFNMQNEAKNSAVQAAISEGKARVNQYAAQYMVSNGAWPAVYDNAVGTNAGDFSLTFSGNASSVSISVIGISGAVIGASSSITIISPGMT